MKIAGFVFSLVFLGCLILFSCAGHQPGNESSLSPVKVDSTSQSFFPLTSFLKGQLYVLDSLPITPLLITTSNGLTDSVWVKKDQIAGLVSPFLDPVITETNLLPFFKESKFADQTINANTFLYEPSVVLPDSITLRSWMVYINTETGNVNKIFMVKSLKIDGQLFTQQLTWQSDKWAKLVTLKNLADGTVKLEKESLLKWSFRD